MYRGIIVLKHKQYISKSISKYKLEEVFSKKWVANQLLVPLGTKIETLTLIYFFIADPKEIKLLGPSLNIIAQHKRRSILNFLKKSKNSSETRSLIRSLQTFILLYNTNKKSDIEKKISGFNKVPDLLSYSDKDEVFIEGFSVNSAEDDSLIGVITEKMRIIINNIQDLKFRVDFKILLSPQNALTLRKEKYNLNQEYGRFEKYLKKLNFKLEVNDEPQEFIFSMRNNEPLVKIELYPPNNNRGYVGMLHSEARFLSEDIRIKGKMIDKFTNLQFHNKNAINGYIIFLEEFLSDVRDVRTAIFGQQVIHFNLENNQPKDKKISIKPNGVIHHELVGKVLLEWIDFIIVVKHPNELLNITEESVMLNEDRNKITFAKVKLLFSNK